MSDFGNSPEHSATSGSFNVNSAARETLSSEVEIDAASRNSNNLGVEIRKSPLETTILMEEAKQLASVNANVMEDREEEQSSTLDLESNVAIQSSSKVPFVSRILPMSRKSSQVVPTFADQLGVVPGSDSNSQDLKGQLLKSSSERKGSDSRMVIVNLPNINSTAAKDDTIVETGEEVCRICHDNPSRMTLLSPCLCKGSMGKVHRTCLERWLGESAKTSCEICGHEYETERRPRYTGWRSIVAWIRHPLAPTDTRNLFFDLACFFIITPLAAISAWLCVVGAQHYSFGQITLGPEGTAHPDSPLYHDKLDGKSHAMKLRNKSVEASNSTWTSIGLLTLTGTLLAAYYVWLFVAVRYHIQVWREWQARNFVVTISPLNTEAIRKLRESREAHVFSPPPETGTLNPGAEASRDYNFTAPTTRNNNNDGESSSSGSGNSNGNKFFTDNKTQRTKEHEKMLAVLQETESLESDEVVLITDTESLGPGPSKLHNSHNNNDTDSLLGKVIVIPSESNCNAQATTKASNSALGKDNKVPESSTKSQNRRDL